MPYADPKIRKEYHRNYYQRNKKKLDAQNSKWASAHRERIREIWQTWKQRHPEDYRRMYKKANHSELGYKRKAKWFAEHPNAVKEYRMTLREQVFEMYGHECARCGFTDKRALQLDHVNDDGALRAPRGSDGKRMNRCEAEWRNAVKEYRPDIYQILCANCNWIKRDEAKDKLRKPWSIRKAKAVGA